MTRPRKNHDIYEDVFEAIYWFTHSHFHFQAPEIKFLAPEVKLAGTNVHEKLLLEVNTTVLVAMREVRHNG